MWCPLQTAAGGGGVERAQRREVGDGYDPRPVLARVDPFTRKASLAEEMLPPASIGTHDGEASMRVAITGETGFVGGHLAAARSAGGHETDEDSVRTGLPEPGRFSLTDLRWCSDRTGPGGGAVLVYDGDCGFCTAAAAWAARRFRHGEHAQPWQVLGREFFEQHGMTLDDARQAAWWVDGAQHEQGHRAVGRALQAGGGLRLVAGWFILHAPSSWLAAGIYRLVARWRYRLPGATPACRVDGRAPQS